MSTNTETTSEWQPAIIAPVTNTSHCPTVWDDHELERWRAHEGMQVMVRRLSDRERSGHNIFEVRFEDIEKMDLVYPVSSLPIKEMQGMTVEACVHQILTD